MGIQYVVLDMGGKLFLHLDGHDSSEALQNCSSMRPDRSV